MGDGDRQIKTSVEKGIPLISITGYFNDEVGEEVTRIAERFLDKGHNRLILDFAPCSLVNSPGIAALMALVLLLVHDRGGKLVLAGCSPIMVKAFSMATIFPRADRADTYQDALRDLTLA